MDSVLEAGAAFKFIQKALSSARQPPPSRSEDVSPELRAFLASREIDGLLSVAGLLHAPWSSIYRDLWNAQLASLDEALRTLSSYDVHNLTFKGAELVTRFFRATPLGLFVDIDILVPKHKLQTAKRVLYELGYLQSYF